MESSYYNGGLQSLKFLNCHPYGYAMYIVSYFSKNRTNRYGMYIVVCFSKNCVNRYAIYIVACFSKNHAAFNFLGDF